MRKLLLYVFSLAIGFSFGVAGIFAFPGEVIDNLSQPGDYFLDQTQYESLVVDCGVEPDPGPYPFGEYLWLYRSSNGYVSPVGGGGGEQLWPCNFMTPDLLSNSWSWDDIDSGGIDETYVAVFVGGDIEFTSVQCGDENLSLDDCVASTTANGIFFVTSTFYFLTEAPISTSSFPTSSVIFASFLDGYLTPIWFIAGALLLLAFSAMLYRTIRRLQFFDRF